MGNSRHFQYYLLRMLAWGVFFSATILLATVLVDAYKVFGWTGFNRKNYLPNVGYLQIEHLKANPGRYHGFILGTSRVNSYDVRDASKLAGIPYYNLTAPRSHLDGMRMQLEWLIAHEDVKEIIVGLDYDFQFIEREQPLHAKLQHPEVSGTPWWRFYLYYLDFDVDNAWQAFKRNALQTKVTIVFESELGQWKLPKIEYEIAQDWNRYEQKNFRRPPVETRRYDAVPLEELRRISELAEKHGIKAYFIIHPYHHFGFEAFDADDFVKWRKAVTESAGLVVDFSGPNEMTQDNRNYYDVDHHTRAAGRRVLEEIFGPASTGPRLGRILSSERGTGLPR